MSPSNPENIAPLISSTNQLNPPIRQQNTNNNNNRHSSNKASSTSNLPQNAPAIPLRTVSSNSSSSLTSTHQLPITTSYQLMGQHILPNHDENSILLRRQLETEIKEKKVLENKVISLYFILFDVIRSIDQKIRRRNY